MLKTVSFYGLAPANGELTLVSVGIGHPYAVRRFRIKFAAGGGNSTLVYLYLSDDDAVPTVGRPNGVSMLAEHGQVDYVTGDDEVVLLDHEVTVPHGNSWLKVYAENQDYNVHAVNVQMTIDTLLRE